MQDTVAVVTLSLGTKTQLDVFVVDEYQLLVFGGYRTMHAGHFPGAPVWPMAIVS